MTDAKCQTSIRGTFACTARHSGAQRAKGATQPSREAATFAKRYKKMSSRASRSSRDPRFFAEPHRKIFAVCPQLSLNSSSWFNARLMGCGVDCGHKTKCIDEEFYEEEIAQT